MPAEVRRHCRQLAEACEFAEPEDIERYAAAVAFLREYPSPPVLDALLGALRDHDGGEVQYELVEACEAYPLREYIPAFVRHAGRLRHKAPRWGRLLFQSVLNTPPARDALLAAVCSAGAAERRHVASWAAEIAAEAPQYRGLAGQLRRLSG